jgi:hypothetical protein
LARGDGKHRSETSGRTRLDSFDGWDKVATLTEKMKTIPGRK